ncbi:exodeoxyribonuclease VII small subunit [Clostridium fallax]|uniref:Exodeoxyribonuclease 7 small subunit n=1 Tax=Clostridium fallax TaxID=1533 RepID=A0A1M4XMF9_9CLOT|nr:exodeoxyribonuclease VII small subunit [Clostridium fallax]SHE94601.1 Exodeoxyribonuclease VII small subunit [Clostridium fallax]SQB06349.1 exonuclease VII, small subunit [Clostridium fallax]
MARKKESYSDLVNKLEDLINNLENEDLDLEDSMKSYEDGVSLINKIYKMLKEYEGKIEIINTNIEKELKE